MSELLWPVMEFRPLPDALKGDLRRFADGAWVPDDGEYDLAFISDFGSPLCLCIELPYQKNIVASWLTTPGAWQAFEPKHPRGNPWHFMLREGTKKWGGDWGRFRHPNRLAGDSGMSKLSGERGCANGIHVEFRVGDKHMEAGLVRERDSKKIVALPEKLVCMYCG